MDSKITLSFDQQIIEKAKAYAKSQNISLSRLTEMLLRRITDEGYSNLDEIPISDWVTELAEGKAEYRKRSKRSVKDEYYNSKR
jgi:hypothetical protein